MRSNLVDQGRVGGGVQGLELRNGWWKGPPPPADRWVDAWAGRRKRAQAALAAGVHPKSPVSATTLVYIFNFSRALAIWAGRTRAGAGGEGKGQVHRGVVVQWFAH